MRGYDRSIEQDQQAGRTPTPGAMADRDRQVALMNDWLKRWDRAIDNRAEEVTGVSR